MGTAFMFYSNSNAWAEGLEGWHGVDQLGEDGTNPNYEAMIERFEARFGRRRATSSSRSPTTRPAPRSTASPTPRSRRPRTCSDGLERIRWMPATNGGPSCYVQFGPGDHKGYKGDFLTFRELRGGELRFDGYYRPEWPSNTANPANSGHSERFPCAIASRTARRRQRGGSALLVGDAGGFDVPRRVGHALVAQLALEHPADGAARQLGAELDVAGQGEVRQLVDAPAEQLLLGERRAVLAASP